MTHEFLSDEWMDAVEALRPEAPEPPAAAKDIIVNLVITDCPFGDREAHLAGGQFERGHHDEAPTKLTVPYPLAKSLFIEGDQQAAMQAFMSGQMKVEGDMTKLMAMQTVGAPSPEQEAFQKKLQDLTL